MAMNESILFDRNENRYGPAPECLDVLRNADNELLFNYTRAFKQGNYSDLSVHLGKLHGKCIVGAKFDTFAGIEFDKWEVPVVDEKTFESSREGVFFVGDAAFPQLLTVHIVGYQLAGACEEPNALSVCYR